MRIADDNPDRTVRVTFPDAAGGIGDRGTRLVGAKLSERLRQHVVVKIHPVSGAIIGKGLVARVQAYGYLVDWHHGAEPDVHA